MTKYQTTSQMISEALTGTVDKDIAIARIGCRSAASRLMVCPICGNILDETRTICAQITDSKTNFESKLAVQCSRCWENMRGEITDRLRGAPVEMSLRIESWSGVEVIKGGKQ